MEASERLRSAQPTRLQRAQSQLYELRCVVRDLDAREHTAFVEIFVIFAARLVAERLDEAA